MRPWLLCLLLLLPWAWATPASADEVDEELLRAHQALDSGRLLDAERGFRELIAQHPALADVLAAAQDGR